MAYLDWIRIVQRGLQAVEAYCELSWEVSLVFRCACFARHLKPPFISHLRSSNSDAEASYLYGEDSRPGVAIRSYYQLDGQRQRVCAPLLLAP